MADSRTWTHAGVTWTVTRDSGVRVRNFVPGEKLGNTLPGIRFESAGDSRFHFIDPPPQDLDDVSDEELANWLSRARRV